MKIELWKDGNWRFTTVLIVGVTIMVLNRIFSGANSAYSAAIPLIVYLAFMYYTKRN
ncbi:hypothetical protein ACFQHW_12740 [Lapidilactobacillus achengensis]|uniref:Uncharacterized protein n=1 Tax=Lapidilactobacillus achengensis TaxID=2486000 RepID=A0ABW1URU8_9LACO|nr:hypothetical protein [Lapidilactobacillus achengensis]